MKIQRQRTEVYSRVVGFIRPINQWNVGKKSEWKDRKYFKESNNKNLQKLYTLQVYEKGICLIS